MPKNVIDPRLRDCLSFQRDPDVQIPVAPLILAVTGHRKIESSIVDVVRARVQSFFLQIGQAWRSSQKPCAADAVSAPILVLCGMAIGADCMAAEVILNLKSVYPDLNFQLVAALPMPMSIYAEDFDVDEDRENFYRLTEAADYRIELPLTQKNQDWVCAHPGESLPNTYRIAQYVELGEFLAANCQYLLALCGQIDENMFPRRSGSAIIPATVCPNPGGSEDVVRMKLARTDSEEVIPVHQRSACNITDFGSMPPVGSVFQIVAPKKGYMAQNGERTAAPGTLWVYR